MSNHGVLKTFTVPANKRHALTKTEQEAPTTPNSKATALATSRRKTKSMDENMFGDNAKNIRNSIFAEGGYDTQGNLLSDSSTLPPISDITNFSLEKEKPVQKAKKKRPKSTNPAITSRKHNEILSPSRVVRTDGDRRLTVHGRRISTVYISDSLATPKEDMLHATTFHVAVPGPLSWIPDELIVDIFAWLEAEDLGKVGIVCKRWNRLAEIDILWSPIAHGWYPEETKIAMAEKKIVPCLPKKTNKSPLFSKKRASLAPLIFSPSKAYKEFFVQNYMMDLVYLKTGIWRNSSWKPKKSPWSKEDYTYVHDSINHSSKNAGIPIKVVVVGDGAVGKTSLLCRYANGEFPQDYIPTIFDNFATNTVYQNQQYSVSLWDTAGVEAFDKLRPLSYIGADIFLLCFDLVNSSSLENSLQRWFEELFKHAPHVPIMLCGTKMDLRVNKEFLTSAKKKNPKLQAISFDMGVAMAKKIGATGYTETSALTGQAVDQVFNEVMRFGCQFCCAQTDKNRKQSCGVM